MTAEPSVADITSYLAASGWVRAPGEWRGAATWTHAADAEVLVPARDGMGDGPRRVREILGVLTAVEGRTRDAIAADIASPMADLHWYRTAGDAAGQPALGAALTALEGARDVLGAAARATVTGPRAAYDGAAPRAVRDLLDQVRLAPAAGGTLALRLPLTGDAEPIARTVLLRLHDALLHVHDAARTRDAAAFDRAVPAGVSADLCAALARFAGPGDGLPFEIGFRWARGRPAAVPARAVAFDAGTGALLRRASHRLRRLRFAGAARVTGAIGILHDDGAHDRYRVRVHGEVTMPHGPPRRALWVRLADAAGYDLAIAAHRTARTVHARGTLATVDGRLELITAPGDFRII
ncbi:hypothetical protein [Actinomadura flavalba]|uniref:hypothetical protein n=1 Tax=Actinomadura flavalba TaxID=1120938 RepID=UPI00036C2A48|nr:hypothetical protein [Actinomadura flavalba]